MAAVDTCPDCTYDIPRGEPLCPHCARPSRFPNVLDASDREETQALDTRHQAALQSAQVRGCEAVLQQFESATARSRAVIARSIAEADRLATTDRNLYATHYQWLRAGAKLPAGDKWDRLRRVADEALFGENKDHIRFAALTLDGIGLDNYGECSLVLRDDMIAHRASVFEENSVKFMERHAVRLADVNDLPHGHRSRWNERHKLCTSKLAARITTTTTPAEFPELLLEQGQTSDEDQFVEVHIWGPMSLRTLEAVTVRRKRNRPRKVIVDALGEHLNKYNVPMQVI